MTTVIDRARARQYLNRLYTDHIFFVQELWRDRKLDRVHPLTDIELDMVDFAFAYPSMDRGILGPRGSGKTTLLTCTLASFRLYRAMYKFLATSLYQPDRKILVISKSAGAAVECIGLMRTWIDHVWFLRHLKPQSDQSDRSNFFDVGCCERGTSKQPSVKALGVDGQLEGNRAHTIIPDDMETKTNTKTQDARDELRRIAGELRNIRFPISVGAAEQPVDPPETVMIGTYKNEDSLYKDRAKKGYVFRTYTLAAPARDDKFLNLAPIIERKLQTGKLKYTENGNYHLNPVFPHRFGTDDIATKMSEGRHEFAMEHMLLANLSDAVQYPLRLSDLIIFDVPRDRAPVTLTWGRQDHNGSTAGKGVASSLPNLGLPGDSLHPPIHVDKELAPFVVTKAVIDPAGVGSDKTGLAIGSLLNGMYWIKHCRGHTGGATLEAMDALAQLLRRHNVREVWVETNIDVFDTYTPLLEVAMRKLFLSPGQDPIFPNGWTCSAERFHAVGMKEDRILSVLAPVFGAHRAVFDPSVLVPASDEQEHETLQYQITRMKRIRKCLKEDGPIDALASLIMRFQETTTGVRKDPARGRTQAIFNEAARLERQAAIARGEQPPQPKFVRSIDA